MIKQVARRKNARLESDFKVYIILFGRRSMQAFFWLAALRFPMNPQHPFFPTLSGMSGSAVCVVIS